MSREYKQKKRGYTRMSREYKQKERGHTKQ